MTLPGEIPQQQARATGVADAFGEEGAILQIDYYSVKYLECEQHSQM